MRSQIKLGRIFGIHIGLHYSWFVIAVLIVYSLYFQFHATNPAWSSGVVVWMAIGSAVLFFISLLLHELAHSIVASSHGLPVKEITLFALGGVSQIEKNPTSAKLEFWMAFVGPLTSIAIGAICVESVRALGRPAVSPWIAILLWLGYINFVLGIFNLIPGYPLDGGRVLRAIIWWKTGQEERSTRLAAKTGQVVAFCFIGYGILEFFAGAAFSGLWMAFIGWFLLQAARESVLQISLNDALRGVRVADVMTHDCLTVDGSLKVKDFVDEKLLRTGQRCFMVEEQGHVAGLVTPHEVRELDRTKWASTTLHDVMRPLAGLHAVTPETPLSSALKTMSQYDLNQLPVLSDHHVDGIVSRSHVIGYIQNRAELRQ